MSTRFFVSVILTVSCFVGLRAAELKPLEKALNPEGAFVCIDLSGEANDKANVSFPAELVEVARIPFRVLRDGEQNHLFMEPIGWAAAKDESKEYPGYMARYDAFPEPDDPTRAAFRIPVSDYSAAWLLAATDDDASLTENLTIRIGRFGKNARTTYHDFTGQVPRRSAEVRRGEGNVVQVIPTGEDNLYLIRIPITRTFVQDFKDYWELHMDITKQLGVAVNLPDPYRFQMRPMGDPSGVRIYGLTLERPSLQMEVVSHEPGNVFNQPQKPAFDLKFRNHYLHYRPHHLEVVTRRDDGVEEVFTFDEFRPWSPVHRVPLIQDTIELDLTERGHYEVTFNLYMGKTLLLQRPTTLAILAPNTRQYRHEAPFGVWDFGGTHTTPADLDLTGSLAVKAGWRYMRDSEKYGLEAFNDPNLIRGNTIDKLIEQKQNAGPDYEPPKRGLIFHETAVSGPHIMRTPDVFTGKTYQMSEKDKERFDTMWEQANTTYAKVREHFPEMEIYFGNGVPHVIEAFCRNGIRKDYLRVAGNECGSFMRPPETQPTDFVANNAGLFMFRRILDHYGYHDTKVYQCFEVTYPNTNPGNLPEDTQARYFIRHMMHSLAWGIPKITPGSVTDMGNSYYHSNWGGSGFCHAYPNVSPKLSYVAYATMTQALDGATFVRGLDLGSTVAYALEFERKDGGHVYCLWTTRGTRPATLDFPWFSRAAETQISGRERALEIVDGQAAVTLSQDPIYVTTNRQVKAVRLGEPRYAEPDLAEAQVIDSLGSLANWTVETERNYELETFNFMNPRRPGDFDYREVAEMAGRQNVLGVKPKPVEGSEYLQMYSVLRLNEPVELAGRPTEIGLWVHGNGGWGRLIFELEDASGQRWISIGTEMGGTPNPWMADWLPKEKFEELQRSGGAGISDWNSNDAWGHSFVNHDGWRFVRFLLPGNHGQKADGYHWPRTSQWRFSETPQVTYPLTFKKLTVTLPEKVLYLDQWAPAANQEIFLSDLQVTSRPLAEAIKPD